MGWERRGEHLYYYRKYRVDGRVMSEYCGCGLLAELDASEAAQKREDRLLERKEREDLRTDLEARETQMRQATEVASILTHAALLAAGYHMHKGQWRKKRG